MKNEETTTKILHEHAQPYDGAAVAISEHTHQKKLPHEIDSVLHDFLLDIKSIQKTHSLVLTHVLDWLKEKYKSNTATLEKYVAEVSEKTTKYQAKSAHQAAELMDALRELDGLGGMRIPDTLQRSLFTQLFSEFDAFTGSLLKVIYKSKEDLLKGISRQITFADLLSYENLNDVKIDMLEKEIENFRRDGYVDQFIALENKFGLKLRGFSEWGEFIELSQRRNLIVHNGGIVNDQYLIICDKEKFQFIQRPNTGDILKPDGKYFTRATIIVSKVAFMLCHTLWSKIFPNQRLDAQEAANGSLYALLLDKRWSTAYEIGLFCLSEPMRSPIEDIDLRLRTINVAIAAKFSKNARRCEEIIKTLDWSASIRDFKLAISVLTERFDEASVLMKQIGKNGELVTQFGYHEWPLFYEFRKTEQFLNSYKEVYEVSFIAEEVRHSAEVAKANEEEFNKSVTDIVDVVPESIPKKRSRKTTSLQ